MIAFEPVRRNGFVNWDDPQNLIQNDAYRGFGNAQLRWMFTSFHGGHYQPLTWLSFAADYSLWGLPPAGFHLTSLILHAATAVGFFFVAVHLIGLAFERKPDTAVVLGGLAATLMFAVHPLRVESVAWATERRDVLSGVWLMTALMLYLRAADHSALGQRRRCLLAASWGCYFLALLSKASGMVLPAVLILIDVFPLRRLRAATPGRKSAVLRAMLLEKIPYLIAGLAAAVLAGLAQRGAGAMWELSEHPLALRLGQAFFGILFYLWKSVWPVGLAPLYEQRPDAAALDWPNVVAAGLVVVATLSVWMKRHRRPALIVCWLCYVVLLAPTLGLFQSGPQVVADRYSYLSCLPWAVLVGAGVAAAWLRLRIVGRKLILGGGVGVTVVLILLTRAQVAIWRDSESLWAAAIRRGASHGLGHVNLAAAYLEAEEFEPACDEARRALVTLPGNRTAHIILGRCSVALGKLNAAEEHLAQALVLTRAIGKTDTTTALALSEVMARLNHMEEAEALLRETATLSPDSVPVLVSIGSFLTHEGRPAEALPFLSRAVDLEAQSVEARLHLAAALTALGKPRDAVALLETGLGMYPRESRLKTRLAWILATCSDAPVRDGSRALRLAEEAVAETGGKRVAALEALAAAAAELGDFERAESLLDPILAADAASLSGTSRERLTQQRERYRERLPIRE